MTALMSQYNQGTPSLCYSLQVVPHDCCHPALAPCHVFPQGAVVFHGPAFVYRAERNVPVTGSAAAQRVAVKQVIGTHHAHVASWVQQEDEALRASCDKPYTVDYNGLYSGEALEDGNTVPCAYLVME